MNELEQKIGYEFRDKTLLTRAMTHSSRANERNLNYSNERLEFLGDSVLGFLTAEFLFDKYPGLSEGELTRLRSLLVCEDSLAVAAQTLGLGDFVLLGHGEKTSRGAERPSLLSDAFEAMLAAMFLDGGLEPVRALLGNLLLRDNLTFPQTAEDAKTALQEHIQKEPGRVLAYRVVSEDGPPHARVFHVEVTLDGAVLGQGSGASKKKAEQEAARGALERLRNFL